MKKLLVVLAVLFATVGSMYATNTGTGSVTVNVICPLTVSNGGAVAFDNIPIGTTTSPAPTGLYNYLTFDVAACAQETAGTNWGSKVVITYVMAPANPANGITLNGDWTYDAVAAPASGTSVDFDGKINVKWTVTSIVVAPNVAINDVANNPEVTYTGTVTAVWATI